MLLYCLKETLIIDYQVFIIVCNHFGIIFQATAAARLTPYLESSTDALTACFALLLTAVTVVLVSIGWVLARPLHSGYGARLMVHIYNGI